MARSLFRGLRDRTSVRQQTALVGGLLCVAAVAIAAFSAASLARRQAVIDVESDLVTLARTMADRLDQHMFERYREIKNVGDLAPLKVIWRGDIKDVRAVLSQIQNTLPEYAWLGFATPDGKVRAATKGMLEGASVAQRPWFIKGMKGPTVEDVHDAKLLDQLLRTDPDQAPFRFVDVAMPIHLPDGTLAGVLGAHMSWTWAADVSTNVLRNHGDASGESELWIQAKDGSMLIGPDNAGKLSPAQIAHVRGAGNLTFIDKTGPQPMLTAVVATRGQGDYPGLGWMVVARRPIATAMAPANTLFATILGLGAAVAIVGAFLAWILAGRMMRPLDQLGRSIDRIGRDPTASNVEWQRGSRDVLHISASIRSLLRRLGSAQRNEREALQSVSAAEHAAAEQVRLAEQKTLQLGVDLDQLRRLADTDPLTGLLNRRAFMPYAADAMGHFTRYGRVFAILMIDIDHFKRVNDTYGHAVGDDVIRTIGDVIQGEVRETDKVARFGGEEYVVLVHESSVDGADILASRIREKTGDTAYISGGSQVRFTISAGVALPSGDDRDIEDVIKRADKALYDAKSSGRNRVVVSGDSRAKTRLA